MELKADAVQLGAVFSILNLASALTIIPGGILTDKYDRKKILFFSWLVWAFAPLAYSLADRWSQLFVGAALWGASMFGAPAITAYVINSVKKESVMSATSIVSASWTMGYVFSPAIGGYLADTFSMRLVLHLSFIFSLLSTSVFLFIASQHPKKASVTQPSPLSVVGYNKRKMVLWAGLLATIAFTLYLTRPFVVPFFQDELHLSDFQVGVLGSATWLGAALLGVFLGRIGDRWKKAGAVFVCMIFYLASVIVLILFRQLPTAALASFLMGGSFLAGTLVSSLIGSIAPEARMGRWISVPQTTGMLAAVFAPFLGGWLYKNSVYYPFIAAIAVTPVLAVLTLTKPLAKEIHTEEMRIH